MIEVSWVVYFLVLGGIVGFIAGLLGVGGGGILVPFLSLMFIEMGVTKEEVMHVALGTSMACIIVTSLSSLHAHHKKGAVQWSIVRGMSLGVILGTFTATFVASHLNSIYLAFVFACFMIWTAVKLVRKRHSDNPCKEKNKVKLFLPAFGIGNISALVSIGGGSLTVPFLVKQNIDIKSAVGTSAAIGLPISIAGTLGYLLNGSTASEAITSQVGFIYLPAVILISLSSFLLAPLGVRVSHQLEVQTLKTLFAILLIALSLKTLWLFV